MKRGEFAIAVEGGPKTVTGWLLTPYWAAHRVYRDWTLTHRPTGKQVFAPFRVVKDVKAAALFLDGQADWNVRDDGLGPTHTEAINKAREHLRYDAIHMRYEWR